jgi:hypothetical protein
MTVATPVSGCCFALSGWIFVQGLVHEFNRVEALRACLWMLRIEKLGQKNPHRSATRGDDPVPTLGKYRPFSVKDLCA